MEGGTENGGDSLPGERASGAASNDRHQHRRLRIVDGGRPCWPNGQRAPCSRTSEVFSSVRGSSTTKTGRNGKARQQAGPGATHLNVNVLKLGVLTRHFTSQHLFAEDPDQGRIRRTDAARLLGTAVLAWRGNRSLRSELMSPQCQIDFRVSLKAHCSRSDSRPATRRTGGRQGQELAAFMARIEGLPAEGLRNAFAPPFGRSVIRAPLTGLPGGFGQAGGGSLSTFFQQLAALAPTEHPRKRNGLVPAAGALPTGRKRWTVTHWRRRLLQAPSRSPHLIVVELHGILRSRPRYPADTTAGDSPQRRAQPRSVSWAANCGFQRPEAGRCDLPRLPGQAPGC